MLINSLIETSQNELPFV